MSASKQWRAEKIDFPMCSQLNKFYNEAKYNELYGQFEKVETHFMQDERIQTLSRMIVEEVSNIIEGNERWNELRVRTEFNPLKTIFKTQIIYDGGIYHDPLLKNTTNVIGSRNSFKKYKRKYEIDNGEVRITVNVEIEKE